MSSGFYITWKGRWPVDPIPPKKTLSRCMEIINQIPLLYFYMIWYEYVVIFSIWWGLNSPFSPAQLPTKKKNSEIPNSSTLPLLKEERGLGHVRFVGEAKLIEVLHVQHAVTLEAIRSCSYFHHSLHCVETVTNGMKAGIMSLNTVHHPLLEGNAQNLDKATAMSYIPSQ